MIDWFTVVAQVVNFLVLVALLRYFLYGRILAAIDHRQAVIKAEREEAEKLLELAQEELEGARREHRLLEQQREELLAEVRQEVDRFREQKLKEVRAEIETLRERWAQTLSDERQSFLRELRLEVSRAVCRIARQVLSSLASADVEQLVVQRFLQELASAKLDWQTAIQRPDDKTPLGVTVRTSFPLTLQRQSEIEQAVQEKIGRPVACEFETSAELVCGISVHFDDHKVAWDFRDALLSLEQELVRSVTEEIDRNVGMTAEAAREG